MVFSEEDIKKKKIQTTKCLELINQVNKEKKFATFST